MIFVDWFLSDQSDKTWNISIWSRPVYPWKWFSIKLVSGIGLVQTFKLVSVNPVLQFQILQGFFEIRNVQDSSFIPEKDILGPVTQTFGELHGISFCTVFEPSVCVKYPIDFPDHSEFVKQEAITLPLRCPNRLVGLYSLLLTFNIYQFSDWRVKSCFGIKLTRSHHQSTKSSL